MPQGPGTYGSKVGRPPKKRKQYGKGGKTSVSKGNPHKRTRIEKLKELNKSKKIKTLRRDLVKKNKIKAV